MQDFVGAPILRNVSLRRGTNAATDPQMYSCLPHCVLHPDLIEMNALLQVIPQSPLMGLDPVTTCCHLHFMVRPKQTGAERLRQSHVLEEEKTVYGQGLLVLFVSDLYCSCAVS